MIIEILKTDLRITVGIGIVAPTKNPCVFNIPWKQVTQPVDSVHSPAFLTMSVEPVHGYKATIKR